MPPSPPLNPEMLETMRLYSEQLGSFKKALASDQPEDQVKYQKMYVVAALHVAAALAVDAGLPPEAFVKIAESSYRAAYDRAPKFGE